MHLHPCFVNLIIGWFIGLALFTISFWVIEYKRGKNKNANRS